jgi:hypothetical protein
MNHLEKAIQIIDAAKLKLTNNPFRNHQTHAPYSDPDDSSKSHTSIHQVEEIKDQDGNIVQKAGQDCYFLASLASAINANPDFVSEMLKDNGDSYSVRFYHDGKEVWITVDKNDERYKNKTSKDWQLIIEDGYRAFLQSYAIEREYNSPSSLKLILAFLKSKTKNSLPWQDEYINMGLPQNSLTALTGNKSEFYITDPLVTNTDEIEKVLMDAKSGKSLVNAIYLNKNIETLKETAKGAIIGTLVGGPIGGAVGALFGSNEGNDVQKFINDHSEFFPKDLSAHVYSVVDYNETDKTVTVFNPWGKSQDRPDTEEIPLDIFIKLFPGIASN